MKLLGHHRSRGLPRRLSTALRVRSRGLQGRWVGQNRSIPLPGACQLVRCAHRTPFSSSDPRSSPVRESGEAASNSGDRCDGHLLLEYTCRGGCEPVNHNCPVQLGPEIGGIKPLQSLCNPHLMIKEMAISQLFRLPEGRIRCPCPYHCPGPPTQRSHFRGVDEADGHRSDPNYPCGVGWPKWA